MKLVQVALARSIRLWVPDTPVPEQQDTKHHYIVDVVTALQQKYKFVQVPRVLDEFDFSTGIKFMRGFYKVNTAIDKLEVYTNGILIEGKHPTESLDEFADDLFDFAKKEWNLAWIPGPRSYLSNIEFQSDIGFGKKFDYLSEIGKSISNCLIDYGQKPDQFHVTQIGFHADTTNVPAPVATSFSVDRRAGKPFSESSYFCSAPLATKDQVRILNELESIFAS